MKVVAVITGQALTTKIPRVIQWSLPACKAGGCKGQKRPNFKAQDNHLVTFQQVNGALDGLRPNHYVCYRTDYIGFYAYSSQ
jgi:hypothetical protein